jgi:hypothetical protein
LLPDGTLASKQSLIFRSREADKLVSVMITCAGHRKHLPDTIASVRAQTLASVEIVVVDDGSDDAETSRSLECLQSQCEIKLVGVNGKTSSASRNDGIAVSTGEYICCLDAGDTLQPTYLEKVVALMETDRSVGFAYSHVRLLGDGENVWTTHDFEIDAALLGEPTALSAVFRRDDWVLLGGFDINEMEGASGDLGFWLRLACLGRCGRSIPEQLVSHRGGMPDKPDPQRAISEDRIQPVSLLTRQFRTTLRRLKPFPRAEPALYKLGQPKLLATQPDHPHILVMVPWLSNGGGELLLFDVLASLRSSYRISILTTLSDAHALSERFATITSEIYHLPRFLAEQDFADFAAAIIGSRQTQLLLSSNCAFAYKSGAALKRSFPDLRWADIMHNALPTGHLKGALAAADHIDCHVAVTAPIVEALRTSDIPEDHIALIPNGV